MIFIKVTFAKFFGTFLNVLREPDANVKVSITTKAMDNAYIFSFRKAH